MLEQPLALSEGAAEAFPLSNAPCPAPSKRAVRAPTTDRAGTTRSILHIGVHKTATNWFQRFVYPAADSHRYLDRPLVRDVILGTPALAFDAAEARQRLGLDRADLPFAICEEDLSGVLHDGGLTAGFAVKEVAHRLHAVAPDAQVVIFVRSQLSLAASCYQQYLREGGTAGPLRYLFPQTHRHLGRTRPLKVPRFDFSQFDQDLLVAHYDSLFRRENVHVFAFEDFRRDPSAMLQALERRFGLRTRSAPDARRRLNGSYRRGLMPVARFANLFTERSVADKRVILHIPYWYTVRKALLEQLNRHALFGKPPKAEQLFGQQAVRWIGNRFAAGNRRLAARMGVDLGALGYAVTEGEDVPMPAPSPLTAWMRN